MSDLLQRIRGMAVEASAYRYLPDPTPKVVPLAYLERVLGGMVLVPREPTPDMIERGYKALMERDARTGEDMAISEVWRAMLPAPTATPGEGE